MDGDILFVGRTEGSVRALSADIADLLTPEAMRRLLGGSLLRVGYLRVSTSSG